MRAHKPWKHVAVGVAMAIALLAYQRGAEASCAAQAEEGTWVNIDAQTRSIPRLVLRFVCQDQIINGQPYPPGPPWYMHLWGSCSPTNCDWGEVGAQRLSSGYVYGTYDHGFARRYVYARMSTVRPGFLYVWIWTDFTSPSRADYSITAYFKRG